MQFFFFNANFVKVGDMFLVLLCENKTILKKN